MFIFHGPSKGQLFHFGRWSFFDKLFLHESNTKVKHPLVFRRPEVILLTLSETGEI